MSRKPGRGSDQFPLRLPDGMRDRIKEAAENSGLSMNAVIVRALKKEFPEPWPLDYRVSELLNLLSAMKKVRGHEAAIDTLRDALLETVEGVAGGRVPDLDDATKRRVQDALDEWYERQARDENERAQWYMDDE